MPKKGKPTATPSNGNCKFFGQTGTSCLLLRSVLVEVLVQIWETVRVAKNLWLGFLKYFGFRDRTNYNFIGAQTSSCVFDRSKKNIIRDHSTAEDVEVDLQQAGKSKNFRMKMTSLASSSAVLNNKKFF
jgi:hypothetical protein